MQEAKNKNFLTSVDWHSTDPETGMVSYGSFDPNGFFQRYDTLVSLEAQNLVHKQRSVLVKVSHPNNGEHGHKINTSLTIIQSEPTKGKATIVYFQKEREENGRSRLSYSIVFTPEIGVSNKSFKVKFEQDGRLSEIELSAFPETTDLLRYQAMHYEKRNNTIRSQDLEKNLRELAVIFKRMGPDFIFQCENAGRSTKRIKKKTKGKIHLSHHAVEDILTPSEMKFFFGSLLALQQNEHISYEDIVSQCLLDSYLKPMHMVTFKVFPHFNVLSVEKSFGIKYQKESMLPFSGESKIITVPYIITPFVFDESNKKFCALKIQSIDWAISRVGKEKITEIPGILGDGELLTIPFSIDTEALFQFATDPSNKNWLSIANTIPLLYHPKQRIIH